VAVAWADFRGKVLGPTNPADAPADSLRGMLNADWQSLGLKSAPNTGDNGVHASASPFEGTPAPCAPHTYPSHYTLAGRTRNAAAEYLTASQYAPATCHPLPLATRCH
jgi:hypothetical protein